MEEMKLKNYQFTVLVTYTLKNSLFSAYYK